MEESGGGERLDGKRMMGERGLGKARGRERASERRRMEVGERPSW